MEVDVSTAMQTRTRRALGWIGAALAFAGSAVLVGAALGRARIDPRLWAGRWELVSLRAGGWLRGNWRATLGRRRRGWWPLRRGKTTRRWCRDCT
jgi:hypothetical protein